MVRLKLERGFGLAMKEGDWMDYPRSTEDFAALRGNDRCEIALARVRDTQ